ncbi:MAG TPA: GAF domain-containing protein, partial [Allocoleopsis sp.]
MNLASLNPESLNSRQLLVDLHRISEITQRFAGCLDPVAIAKQTTDGLVQTFDCAFARIWLMEPNQTQLRLVASSGLYTHTNGSFAQVPVGAFKVGKIAQNRIPFLSNRLPDEAWVKDREWAIRHGITGFAGYPLVVADRVMGVLALFSYHPLSSEFLEVLQGLCTTVALVLDTALHYQQERQSESTLYSLNPKLPLSEQLAAQLSTARFTLVGTERSLSPPLTYVLLRLAEGLSELNCTYCRLNYEDDRITVEAMLMPAAIGSSGLDEQVTTQVENHLMSQLGDLFFPVTCLAGDLQIMTGTATKVVQVALQLPYF